MDVNSKESNSIFKVIVVLILSVILIVSMMTYLSVNPTEPKIETTYCQVEIEIREYWHNMFVDKDRFYGYLPDPRNVSIVLDQASVKESVGGTYANISTSFIEVSNTFQYSLTIYMASYVTGKVSFQVIIHVMDQYDNILKSDIDDIGHPIG